MIAIAVKTKKELKSYVGQSISHMVIETSLFGREYSDNVNGIPFVGPGPYQRKFYGQITVVDGILTKVK